MSAAQVAAGLAWDIRGGLTPDELAQRAWLAGDYATEAAILRAAETATEGALEARDEEHASEVAGLQAQIGELEERLKQFEHDTPTAAAANAARTRAAQAVEDERRKHRELLRQVAICLQTKAMAKAAARKSMANMLHSGVATPGALAHLRDKLMEPAK